MRKFFFEQHTFLTMSIIGCCICALLYGLFFIKWVSNAYTEFEKKSIKLILHQYHVGKIIDNNIGRFIKLREHPPLRTWEERPSKRYMQQVDLHNLERKYYKVHTDQYGFIGPTELYKSPDFKIVFLGGSTTECLYMEETERFPYLVGRKLESLMAVKVHTYNGGVSANETLHSINILINKVLPMQPDVVVLMEGINDLMILRAQGSYWYQDSLKSHVQTSKNVLTRYEFPPHASAVPLDVAGLQEKYRKNIKLFIAVCRTFGIQPVLMTQAHRASKEILQYQFNEVLRNIGKDEGVLVIDLEKAIPKTPEYLYDAYHYTALGSEYAAHQIAQSMISLLTNNNMAFR